MASLRKKPNSKFWYACFKLPDGTRAQRSTKTTDKKTALRYADEYEMAANQLNTESQVRRVITDIYHRVSGKRIEFQSIADFLKSWQAMRKGTITDKTHGEYQTVIESFIRHLGTHADDKIPTLTTDDIRKFRDTQAKRLSPVTVNWKLKVIRSALEDAWRDGLIDTNPASRVQSLKRTTSGEERRAFTMDELKAILRSAHGEWPGIIRFGLYTGQRLGDIARLTWRNIDMAEQTLTLTTQKTERRQIIPVAPPLLNWLQEFRNQQDPEPKPSTPLFPNSLASVTRTNRVAGLSNQFYDILAKAELAPKRKHRKKPDGQGRSSKRSTSSISFHSLRHTATSLMKSAGVSSAIVQEFVGHDSKAVSQQYTHIDTESLREAANRIPAIS